MASKYHRLIHEASAYWKVQYWFFAHPKTAIGLNELVRKVGMAKTTANAVINELVSEGFLTRQIVGSVWCLTANMKHPYMKSRKVPYHLSLLYESGLLHQIKNTIQDTSCVTLLGDHRLGIDHEESAVDVGIEVDSRKNIRFTTSTTLSKLGFRHNVPLNFHIYSRNGAGRELLQQIETGLALH